MSLFQNAIVKNYLKGKEDKIDSAYAKFSAFFHNPERQQNIRDSKEEQFQEGFLRELFVNVLGYTLNPEPDYNLITEQKNETDSKKADAAILVNSPDRAGGEVTGVIELKDGKTTDLKQVEAQAFGYKNSHRNAVYVIISNFEKLRFYIDNSVEFIEFNLFTLTKDDFAVLWLCLNYEHIAKNLPKQIKNESVNSEDQVTKKLYKDYAAFKRALFEDLTNLNPSYDKLVLFKKSQKLIDRFLFILFAEDSGLLPPNSVLKTIDQWKRLKEEFDEQQPLYDRFKKYFGYLNTGFKNKDNEIFAYNGGLFLEDEILDDIKITDSVLQEHLTKICGYDFSSEVDVNILGHIFENSLTEIEELTNAITQGTSTDTTVGKRKKDGVFYTPRYITSYIVENTLGKLCSDKKQEMGIIDAEYFSDKKRTKAVKQKLDDKLLQYRDWLLQLTICDPACGSGAFLNAALDFLINEHKLIDEMRAKINDGVYQLFDNIENSILENNLFGVDINEESVEIAKLSLWLRTAKPHRKLNSLNENIKCGNSLISDKNVAGDKAFDWEREFPKVFGKEISHRGTEDTEEEKKNLTTNHTNKEKRKEKKEERNRGFDIVIGNPQSREQGTGNREQKGFDVIIGNPPYVRPHKIDDNEKVYLWNKYKVASQKTDLYAFFTELGLSLLKKQGVLSYIMPKTWFSIHSFKNLRELIINNYKLNQIGILPQKVFEDAIVETSIIIIENTIANNKDNIQFYDVIKNESIRNINIKTIRDDSSLNINENPSKELKNTIPIGEITKIIVGIATGNDKMFCRFEKLTELDKKAIRGANISRYLLNYTGEYLWYNKEEMIKESNSKPKSTLKGGGLLCSPKEPTDFEVSEKIVMQRIAKKIIATLDTNQYYAHTSVILISSKDVNLYSNKYLLTVLNSSFVNNWLVSNSSNISINVGTVQKIPIPIITLSDQQPFIDLADQMLSLNAELQMTRQTFVNRLNDNFNNIKITGAIENFYELDFKQFLAELKKQKIEISLKQQDEWSEYFNDKKDSCRKIAEHIAQTDKSIDTMVYELYGLSDAEITAIERL